MVRLAAGVDPTLHLIVSELTRVAQPELLLLFGSRANDSAHEESDYDLLVVFADGTDLEVERQACNRALREAGVSADVLARTASQYMRQQRDPGFLDWLIAREGRVLYATGSIEQRMPPPPGRVSESTEGFDFWLERADGDFRLAQLTLASAEPVRDAICFHAHAAVEKLLKAQIVKRGTFPPKTHDLSQLLALQPDTVRNDQTLRQACAVLNELYPKSRYPELPMPSLDEAHRAMDAAVTARDRLRPGS